MMKIYFIFGVNFFLYIMVCCFEFNPDVPKYCTEIKQINPHRNMSRHNISEIKLNNEIMMTFYVKSDPSVSVSIFFENEVYQQVYRAILEQNYIIEEEKRDSFTLTFTRHLNPGKKLLSVNEWCGFWLQITSKRIFKIGKKGDYNSLFEAVISSYTFNSLAYFGFVSSDTRMAYVAFHCNESTAIEENCKLYETHCASNDTFIIDEQMGMKDSSLEFFVKLETNTFNYIQLSLSPMQTFYDEYGVYPILKSDESDNLKIFAEKTTRFYLRGDHSDYTNEFKFSQQCQYNNSKRLSVISREWHKYVIDIGEDPLKSYVKFGDGTANFSIEQYHNLRKMRYYSFHSSINGSALWAHQCNFESKKTNSTPPETKSDDNNTALSVLLASFGVFISLLFVIFCVCFSFWYRRQRKIWWEKANNASAFSRWMKEVVIQRNENLSNFLQTPLVKIVLKPSEDVNIAGYSENSEYKMIEDNQWEFARETLKLGKFLGEGEFGKVIKAEAWNIAELNTWSTVAVKMLKEPHTDEDMINLVSELEMMKLIGSHKHILGLLGCCTQRGPLFIIVEYAYHGNLKNFLNDHHFSVENESIALEEGFKLNNETLISFANQIALGMEYLSSIRCIHRDLAARNVLVCKGYLMKIADFGLARDVYAKDYYKKETKGKMPIKWMSPEAIFHRVYTCKSDVWSYGILLWEIMTFGGIPYPTISNCEELMSLLSNGYRMSAPLKCPSQLYELMKQCWNYCPKDRPDFPKIVKILNEILADMKVSDIESSEPESEAEVKKSTICAEIHAAEHENMLDYK